MAKLPVRPSPPRPPDPVAPRDRPPEEQTSPGETLFFQRRPRKEVALLPFLLLATVILGSGVLVVWIWSGGLPPPASARRPEAARADQPLLSPAEAKARAEEPVSVVSSVPTPAPNPEPGLPRTRSSSPGAAPAGSSAPPIPGQAETPPDPVTPAGPATEAAPPEALNLDLATAENAEVRREVLTRIDLMPDVSAANKDKLYAAVDRARGMGRVAAVGFEKGRLAPSEAEAAKLQRVLQTPSTQRLRDDPTVVFVLLGYADQTGDPKSNYQVSVSRARAVADYLRNRGGVLNVLHAIGMGGSTLFSRRETEKNRVVEVWAVLP